MSIRIDDHQIAGGAQLGSTALAELRPNREYQAGSFADNLLRDAAHKEIRKTTATVGGHNYYIGAKLLRR